MNIKDVLKAISEICCGRLVSYKQINFIKTENAIFIYIYVCTKRLTNVIVCLHCHVLFTSVVEWKIIVTGVKILKKQTESD